MERADFIAAAIQALGAAEIASRAPATPAQAWDELKFDHPQLTQEHVHVLIPTIQSVVDGGPRPPWMEPGASALAHISQAVADEAAAGSTAATDGGMPTSQGPASLQSLCHLQLLLALLHPQAATAHHLALRHLPAAVWSSSLPSCHLSVIAASPPATATHFASALRAFVATREEACASTSGALLNIVKEAFGRPGWEHGPVATEQGGEGGAQHPWQTPLLGATWAAGLLCDIQASSEPSATFCTALQPAVQATTPALVAALSKADAATLPSAHALLLPWVSACRLDADTSSPLAAAAVSAGVVRGTAAVLAKLPTIPAAPSDVLDFAVDAIELLLGGPAAAAFLPATAGPLAAWCAGQDSVPAQALLGMLCHVAPSTVASGHPGVTGAAESLKAAVADCCAAIPGPQADLPAMLEFSRSLSAARSALQSLLLTLTKLLHAAERGVPLHGDLAKAHPSTLQAAAAWRKRLAPALADIRASHHTKAGSASAGEAAATAAGEVGHGHEQTPMGIQADKALELAAAISASLGRSLKLSKRLAHAKTGTQAKTD